LFSTPVERRTHLKLASLLALVFFMLASLSIGCSKPDPDWCPGFSSMYICEAICLMQMCDGTAQEVLIHKNICAISEPDARFQFLENAYQGGAADCTIPLCKKIGEDPTGGSYGPNAESTSDAATSGGGWPPWPGGC
jgi:hypothetical protein